MLTELDLSYNFLGLAGIQLLVQCLRVQRPSSSSQDNTKNNHHHYQKILSSNHYHHHGHGHHQQQQQHIRTLKLIHCGITNGSTVKILMNALMDNTTLTTLNVSHNNFGNRGARQCLALLKRNHSITSLEMIGCCTGGGVSGSDDGGNVRKSSESSSLQLLMEIQNQLRYNNSFFKTLGVSTDVSLAVMDSWTAVESFGNEYFLGTGGSGSGSGIGIG